MKVQSEFTIDEVLRGGIPWYLFPDGRAFPVIRGAEDDDAGDGDGDGGDDDADGDGDGDGDGSGDGDDTKDPKARLEALQAANDRLSAKVGKRDKALKDLNTRLAELEAEKKTPDEKVQGQLDSLTASVSEKDGRIAELELEVRVLSHEELSQLPAGNRKIILRNLKEDIEIDDDGDDNLQTLIDALKKEVPSLFEVKKEEDDGDGSADAGGASGNGKPKTKPMNKKTKPDGGLDRSRLEQKFPALKNRR
jgi:hypothetical protein